MSHGADGAHPESHGGASSHGGPHMDFHGTVSHAAMHAALGGVGHSHEAQYGAHAVVFAAGGILSGGHVISTMNTAHAYYGTQIHVDGIGSNQVNPKDIRIGDIKGVDLLVAHALGLKDQGCGHWGFLLDEIAEKVGVMRIDPRPNNKGMDEIALDGILPWNAFGDLKSKIGPDGNMPLLHGLTDRQIHIFAIPKWGKLNGRLQYHVSPDEVVIMAVRLTAWHYAETEDAELKVELVINRTYVVDPFSQVYTFYGKRTEKIEVKALELMKELFARVTAPDQMADPKPREAYARKVGNLPHRKGKHSVPPGHGVGIRQGTEDEVDELNQEDMKRVKDEDRRIEDIVAAGTAAPTPPVVTGDDDSSDVEALSSPAAVVAGPGPVEAAAATQVSGTFTIPVDLKK